MEAAVANATKWHSLPAASSASRVLYTNPVCLLGTRNETEGSFNFMTVSWLTATDNRGGVFLSLNSKRHSVLNIRRDGAFTLSVATRGMEELLLRVGSCSGRDFARGGSSDTCGHSNNGEGGGRGGGGAGGRGGGGGGGEGDSGGGGRAKNEDEPGAAKASARSPFPSNVFSSKEDKAKALDIPVTRAGGAVVNKASVGDEKLWDLMSRFGWARANSKDEPLFSSPAWAALHRVACPHFASPSASSEEGEGEGKSDGDGDGDGKGRGNAMGKGKGKGKGRTPPKKLLSLCRKRFWDSFPCASAACGTCAHVCLRVRQITAVDGHVHVLATAEEVWVDPRYWHEGKLMAAAVEKEGGDKHVKRPPPGPGGSENEQGQLQQQHTPPLLSFLGSKFFAAQGTAYR